MLTFLLILLFVCCKVNSSLLDESFRGAVIEYGTKYSNRTAKDTVLLNAYEYKRIVETLKSKYDDLSIVVFPEGGLCMHCKSLYAEEIPDPSLHVIPCNNNITEAVQLLSCAARNNSVYLVVNLSEKRILNETILYYNTNVIFSRNGSVVARYRKYNIYGYQGKPFSKTDKPDISYVDTDFGIRLGTFICFDINFKSPALDLVYKYNVTHLAFSTAWYSQLPHLTAIQTQSGWAHATNTILLASGYNDPVNGATGTGFYFGKLRYIDNFDNLSIQSQIKGDFAIISYVPKSPNAIGYLMKSEVHYFYNATHPLKAPLTNLRDHLQYFSTKPIVDSKIYGIVPESRGYMLQSNTHVNETLCDRGLCCEFKFQMKKFYIYAGKHNEYINNGDAFGLYKYRLSAFNGVRSYGGGIATGGVQICSILSCLNDSVESCGLRTDNHEPSKITYKYDFKYEQYFTVFSNVTIKAKLITNNTFVFSYILLSSADFKREDLPKQSIFGKTINSVDYDVLKLNDTENCTAVYSFVGPGNINNPSSINLYNRVFNWDGHNATKDVPVTSGINSRMSVFTVLFLIVSVYFLKLCII